MSEQRCENCAHWIADYGNAGQCTNSRIVYVPDGRAYHLTTNGKDRCERWLRITPPPPAHTDAEWQEVIRRYCELTHECLHEVNSPMARLDRGERSEDLWQILQDQLNQHTDAEWFELAGRYHYFLSRRFYESNSDMLVCEGLAHRFNRGDRSEALWNEMQKAVNHA